MYNKYFDESSKTTTDPRTIQSTQAGTKTYSAKQGISWFMHWWGLAWLTTETVTNLSLELYRLNQNGASFAIYTDWEGPDLLPIRSPVKICLYVSHLESKWCNSHVLVYHGPLRIATFWELRHLLSVRCRNMSRWVGTLSMSHVWINPWVNMPASSIDPYGFAYGCFQK